MTSAKDINQYVMTNTLSGKIDREMGVAILERLGGGARPAGIAVIGLECAYSDAPTKTDYWNHLMDQRSSIRSMPLERAHQVEMSLNIPLSDEHVRFNPMGYLDRIDHFDPAFFRISAREACMVDPKQRLFMQVLYHALEDAGYGGSSLMGTRTGVYVGVDHLNDMEFPYKALIAEKGILPQVGVMPGLLAGRVSYLFDWSGPSMVFDTACSSSLVALDAAVRALREKRCETAVVGGVNLALYTRGETNFASIESLDTRVQTFDRRASGTNWGEGAAAVVLKPLDQALTDRDHIYAVVRSVAVNNDGTTNGVSAPNPEAQERVITQAWKESQINPEDLTYIEAHGTGTVVGDQIEMRGLTAAFRHYTAKRQFCGIGSVKANIGHAVGASGLAGLLKVALALDNEVLPPTINFEEPNPGAVFSESPVYVVDRPLPWPRGDAERLAGVSSFGFSGTNVHAIVESAPVASKPDRSDSLELLALSTHHRDLAPRLIGRFTRFLSENPTVSLADVCFTANTGRRHSKWRFALLAASVEDLRDQLKALGARLARDEDVMADTPPSTESRDTSRLKSAIETFVNSNRTDGAALNEIAQCYLAGLSVDWNALYAGRGRHRLALPVSPLLETTCWPPKGTILDNVVVRQMGAQNDTPGLVTSTAQWFVDESLVSAGSPGSWLVLHDSDDFATAILKQLRQRGDSVVEVTPGKYDTTAMGFQVEVDRASDFGRLVDDLAASTGVPERVLYLWSRAQEAQVDRCFHRLLRVLRAIHPAADKRPIVLTAVTQGSSRLPKDATPLNDQAALVQGVIGVANREYPRLACKQVDVEFGQDGLNSPETIATVVAEAATADGPALVTLRYGARLRQAFRQIDLTVPAGAGQGSLVTGGLYLVTGGLGGIGEALANHLMVQFDANVVLTGVTELPPEDQWDDLLADPAAQPHVVARVKALLRLRSIGPHVEYHAARAEDPIRMEQLVTDCQARLADFDGVFHLAGLSTGGLIELSGPEDHAAVLAPKVEGTLVLDAIFAKRKLGLMMLFSSITAIITPAGMAAYSAACSFQDSYARGAALAYPGRRTICVNWASWGEVGMAVQSRRQPHSGGMAIWQALGGEISVADGLRAIDTLAAQGSGQVAVTHRSVDAIMAEAQDKASITAEGIQHTETGPRFERPDLSSSYVKPSTDTEKVVAAAWEEAFSIDGIGTLDNFQELGGDSLRAIALASTLGQDFQIEVGDIYTYPTIQELSEHLAGRATDRHAQLTAVADWLSEEHPVDSSGARWDQYRAQVDQVGPPPADSNDYTNVLLLGATGFVGIYLLRELLVNTPAEVHVLVRARPGQGTERLTSIFANFFPDEARLLDADRVQVLEADAAAPDFGLPARTHQALAKQVDCVINSAGRVVHFGRPEDFRGPNIDVVGNVLAFAEKARPKQIHHLSTSAVMGIVTDRSNEIFTEFDLDIGQSPLNPYGDSKAQAERMLQRAREQGCSVTVYRLNDIAGHSSTGQFQQNIDDSALYIILRALHAFAQMPRADVRFLPFTHVDEAASRLIAVSRRLGLLGGTYHLMNARPIGFPELRAAFDQLGHSCELVGIREFTDYLSTNFDNPKVGQHVQDFLTHSGFLRVREFANSTLMTGYTERVLESIGLGFTPPTPTDLVRIYNHCTTQGFIKPTRADAGTT